MSPRLPRVTATELLRALRRDGWYIARQDGTSHAQLRHPEKPGRVTIALHVQKSVPPKTLARMLAAAGLTVDELRELL